MIAWAAWLLLAPLLLVVEGWASLHLPLRVDLTAVLCVTLGLSISSTAVPMLLWATAVARALLAEGDLAMHFLVLGAPVAVLLAARVFLDERSWPVRSAAMLLVAAALPAWGDLVGRLAGQPLAPLPVGALDLLATVLVGPLVQRLLLAATPLRAWRVAAAVREVVP